MKFHRHFNHPCGRVLQLMGVKAFVTLRGELLDVRCVTLQVFFFFFMKWHIRHFNNNAEDFSLSDKTTTLLSKANGAFALSLLKKLARKASDVCNCQTVIHCMRREGQAGPDGPATGEIPLGLVRLDPSDGEQVELSSLESHFQLCLFVSWGSTCCLRLCNYICLTLTLTATYFLYSFSARYCAFTFHTAWWPPLTCEKNF